MPPLLVVSVHDVAAATTTATRIWGHALARTEIPLTFLVVPGPWRGPGLGQGGSGAELVAWLRRRQDRGDEVAVHGWLHRADVPGRPVRRMVGTAVARGAAEFWTADRALVARRTRDGLQVLDRLGLSCLGSTPPGWLSSRAARAGLADAGLHYVTDHAGLVDLTDGRRWWAPALCHRPAASGTGPAGSGIGLERLGRRVVGLAVRRVRAGRPVRIGLHPADLERPGLLRQTVSVIEACLDAGAEPVTYAEVLTRLRARG